MGRSPLRPKATDRKISGVDLLHPALLERMRQGRNFWLRGQNGFRRFRTEKTCAVCSISSKASSPSSGARRCATFASHRNKPLKERIIAAVDPFNQDPVVHAASHVVLFAAPTRRRRTLLQRSTSWINFLRAGGRLLTVKMNAHSWSCGKCEATAREIAVWRPAADI
jgi:hypothetical protein